ncbi:MAG: hypothetical protein ACD_79C00621G0001, partial [uncultured bacterium]
PILHWNPNTLQSGFVKNFVQARQAILGGEFATSHFGRIASANLIGKTYMLTEFDTIKAIVNNAVEPTVKGMAEVLQLTGQNKEDFITKTTEALNLYATLVLLPTHLKEPTVNFNNIETEINKLKDNNTITDSDYINIKFTDNSTAKVKAGDVLNAISEAHPEAYAARIYQLVRVANGEEVAEISKMANVKPEQIEAAKVQQAEAIRVLGDIVSVIGVDVKAGITETQKTTEAKAQPGDVTQGQKLSEAQAKIEGQKYSVQEIEQIIRDAEPVVRKASIALKVIDSLKTTGISQSKGIADWRSRDNIKSNVDALRNSEEIITNLSRTIEEVKNLETERGSVDKRQNDLQKDTPEYQNNEKKINEIDTKLKDLNSKLQSDFGKLTLTTEKSGAAIAKFESIEQLESENIFKSISNIYESNTQVEAMLRNEAGYIRVLESKVKENISLKLNSYRGVVSADVKTSSQKMSGEVKGIIENTWNTVKEVVGRDDADMRRAVENLAERRQAPQRTEETVKATEEAIEVLSKFSASITNAMAIEFREMKVEEKVAVIRDFSKDLKIANGDTLMILEESFIAQQKIAEKTPAVETREGAAVSEKAEQIDIREQLNNRIKNFDKATESKVTKFASESKNRLESEATKGSIEIKIQEIKNVIDSIKKLEALSAKAQGVAIYSESRSINENKSELLNTYNEVKEQVTTLKEKIKTITEKETTEAGGTKRIAELETQVKELTFAFENLQRGLAEGLKLERSVLGAQIEISKVSESLANELEITKLGKQIEDTKESNPLNEIDRRINTINKMLEKENELPKVAVEFLTFELSRNENMRDTLNEMQRVLRMRLALSGDVFTLLKSKGKINAEYLSKVIIGRGNENGEMVKLMDTLSMYSTYRGLYGDNTFSNLVKRSVKIDPKTVQEAYNLGKEIDILKADQKISETLSTDLTEINEKVLKLERDVNKLTAEEKNENQSKAKQEEYATQREAKEKELTPLKEKQLRLNETAEKVKGRDLKVELTQKQERYKEVTKDFSMDGETVDIVTDLSGKRMIGVSNNIGLTMKMLEINKVKLEVVDSETYKLIKHLRGDKDKSVDSTTVTEFLGAQKDINRATAKEKMRRSITEKDIFALEFIEKVMKGILVDKTVKTKEAEEKSADEFKEFYKALNEIKSKINAKDNEAIVKLLNLEKTREILRDASDKLLSRFTFGKKYLSEEDMKTVLKEVLSQVFEGMDKEKTNAFISKLVTSFELSSKTKLKEINTSFEKTLLEDLKRESVKKYLGMVKSNHNTKIIEILKDSGISGKLQEAIKSSKYDRKVIAEAELTELCVKVIETIKSEWSKGAEGILDILQDVRNENKEFADLVKDYVKSEGTTAKEKEESFNANLTKMMKAVSEVLVGKYGKETRAMSKEATRIYESTRSELTNEQKDIFARKDGLKEGKKLTNEEQQIWEAAEKAFWGKLWDNAYNHDQIQDGRSAVWKELFGEDGIGSYDREKAKIGDADKVEVEGLLIKSLSEALIKSSADLKKQNIEASKDGKVMSQETKLKMYSLFDLGLMIENKHHLFANQMLASIKLIENGGLVTDMGGGKSFIGAAAGYMFNLSGFGPVRIVTPTENLAIRDAQGNSRIFERLGMKVNAIEEYMKNDETALKEKMLGENSVHYIAKSMPGFMKMDIQSRPTSTGEYVADRTFATIVDEADTLLETIARHEKQIIAQEAKNLLKDPIENALVKITAEYVIGLNEGRIETKQKEESKATTDTPSAEVAFEFDPNNRRVWLTDAGRELIKSKAGELKNSFNKFIDDNIDKSKLTSEQNNRLERMLNSEFSEVSLARRVTNALTAMKEMENHTSKWLIGEFVLRNLVNNLNQLGMRSNEVASYEEYYARNEQLTKLNNNEMLLKELPKLVDEGILPEAYRTADMKMLTDTYDPKDNKENTLVDFFKQSPQMKKLIEEKIEAAGKEGLKIKTTEGKEVIIRSIEDLKGKGLSVKDLLQNFVIIKEIEARGQSKTSNETDELTAIMRQSSIMGWMSGTLDEYADVLEDIGVIEKGVGVARVPSKTMNKAKENFAFVDAEDEVGFIIDELTNMLGEKHGSPVAVNFVTQNKLKLFRETINNKALEGEMKTKVDQLNELMEKHGYSFNEHTGDLDSSKINAKLEQSGHRKILLSTIFGRGDEIKLAMASATAGQFEIKLRKALNDSGAINEADIGTFVEKIMGGQNIEKLMSDAYLSVNAREVILKNIQEKFNGKKQEMINGIKTSTGMGEEIVKAMFNENNFGSRNEIMKYLDAKKPEDRKSLIESMEQNTVLKESILRTLETLTGAKSIEDGLKSLEGNAELSKNFKAIHNFGEVEAKAWTRIRDGVRFINNFRFTSVELRQSIGRVARLTDPGAAKTYLTDEIAKSIWDKGLTEGSENKKLYASALEMLKTRKELKKTLSAIEDNENASSLVKLKIMRIEEELIDITIKAQENIKLEGFKQLKKSVNAFRETELIQDKIMDYKKEFFKALTRPEEASSEMVSKAEYAVKKVLEGLVSETLYKGSKDGLPNKEGFEVLERALARMFNAKTFEIKEEFRNLEQGQFTEHLIRESRKVFDRIGTGKEDLMQQAFFDIAIDEFIKGKNAKIDAAKQSIIPFSLGMKKVIKELVKESEKIFDSANMIKSVVENGVEQVRQDIFNEKMTVLNEKGEKLEELIKDESSKLRKMQETMALEAQKKAGQKQTRGIIETVKETIGEVVRPKAGDIIKTVVRVDSKEAGRYESEKARIFEEESNPLLRASIAIEPSKDVREKGAGEAESISLGDTLSVVKGEIQRKVEAFEETKVQTVRTEDITVEGNRITMPSVESPALKVLRDSAKVKEIAEGQKSYVVAPAIASDDDKNKLQNDISKFENQLKQNQSQLIVADGSGNIKSRIIGETKSIQEVEDL